MNINVYRKNWIRETQGYYSYKKALEVAQIFQILSVLEEVRIWKVGRGNNDTYDIYAKRKI